MNNSPSNETGSLRGRHKNFYSSESSVHLSGSYSHKKFEGISMIEEEKKCNEGRT